MINQVSEGIHYELTPLDDENNIQAWAVRLLEGPHPETVIKFGNIKFDPDDDCLRFNFVIESSPNGDLTEEDVDLQEFAADVLEDILDKAAADGQLATRDSK